MVNLPGSKTGLALIGGFLRSPLTIFPRQATATVNGFFDALIRNRKHDRRTQLQLDLRSAFVAVIEDQLKEQSEADSCLPGR